MKKSLTYIIFYDLLFVLLLAIAGSLGGVLGDTIYYFAFLVPISLALGLSRVGEVSFSPPKLRISTENMLLTLPVTAPTLALIFFVSWLTSLLLSRFGEGSVTDVSGNIISVIFTHALLTAILEEALFRYIPLAYLAGYSKRGAVLFSALFFALAHCNLFQIPYAFIAGVIFAALDIAFDSVIPSLIIHFVNNLISIIWLRGGGERNFVTVYIIILVSAAILSLIPVLILRKKYASKITEAFKQEE